MSAKRWTRVDRAVIRWFGRSLLLIHWAFFLAGVAGAIGTGIGVLPPFNGSWWAKLTSILLWLVLAEQGYTPLAERASDDE